jgi:hypothetical protein
MRKKGEMKEPSKEFHESVKQAVVNLFEKRSNVDSFLEGNMRINTLSQDHQIDYLDEDLTPIYEKFVSKAPANEYCEWI